MKRILSIFSFITILAIFAGCSEDSGSNPTDPFGGGGGTNTGGVVFTIGQRNGDQGGIMFTCKPSVAVTVTELTVSLPAQNYTDPYQGDGTTVFQAGVVVDVGEYTGVASGQQWSFNFKGKIGNAQGKDYNVTSTYTIP